MKFRLHFGRLVRGYTVLTIVLFCTHIAYAQKAIQIVGAVSDANKQPVSGTTIVVQGANKGTTTDAKGRYSITAPANGTLVFSFLGMETQRVKIDGRTVINVVLKDDQTALEEVVVIGYGTSTKRDLTGSVGKVDMSAVEKTAATSIDQALGGRIAGLNIISTDGAPGSESSVSIRSGGFSQEDTPLYIIDGFPIENFSLNTLDPKSIESIDVLKDASSIAIYGSRGANGVIIINTKTAKEGKPRINYSANVSVNVKPDFIDMLSPYDYVKLQLDLESLDLNRTYMRDRYLGKADPVTGARERSIDWYRNEKGIDWQDEITRNSITHSHSLSISGGTKDTKYNVVLGYTNQQGIIINSGMERYSAKGSLEQRLFKNLKAQFSINHTSTTTDSNDAFNQARQYFPTTGLFDINSFVNDMEDMLANGSLSDAGVDYGSLITPLQQANNMYDKRYQKQTQVNFKLDWTFGKYFTFTPSFGLTNTSNKRDKFYNSKTRQGMLFVKSNGSPVNNNGINASRNIDDVKSILSENILTYNRKFNNGHKLNVIAGFTYQVSEWNPYNFTVVQIPQAFENEKFDRLDVGVVLNNKVGSQRSGNRLASLLGRVNYNIKDKYLFTASVRDDGSSKLAKGHQWGIFPSGAFGWRISEEKFMQPLKTFLDDAKFRASYGVIGNNRSVMDYAYLMEFNAGDVIYNYPIDGGDPERGIVPFFYANPDLTWEKTKEWDFGLDLYMFKSRVNISMDYYRKVVSDLLIARPVPNYLGYGNGANTRVENAGATQTNGFEFTINTVNVRTRDFVWTTNLNFSYMTSKIKEFYRGYDVLASEYNGFAPKQTWLGVAGGSTSQYYGFKSDGLYQIKDFDKDPNGQYTLKPGIVQYATYQGGYKLQPGDPKYQDLNGDGQIDDNDRTTLGSPMAPITGGFSNTFRYKNWSLDIFFQFSYGNKLINYNDVMYSSTGSFNRYSNQFASYANYWTPENPNTDIPRLTKPNVKGDVGNTTGARLSDRFIEDGSFLRLKNLSLSYNVPKKFVQKMNISGIQLTFSAQNLWVWTRYTGQDPEVNSYYTGASNANRGMGYVTITNSSPYSSLTGGLDNAAYPKAAIFNLGVNVTF